MKLSLRPAKYRYMGLYGLTLIMILHLNADALAQRGCGLVHETRNSNFTEGKAIGASVGTEDYYTVMYEKVLNLQDTVNYPQYMVSLVCAARHPLPDSMLTSTGVMEVLYDDLWTVTWNGATCSNMPVLAAWSFECRLTEKEFEVLSRKKIRSIGAFQVVETGLSERSQNKLLKVAECLLAK